jgi:hypothetical protein
MNQQDPFAAVRLKSKQQSQPIQQEQKLAQESNQNDPFQSVRIKKSEDLPMFYETGRHAARIGSRIAETIGGIPGDVSSLLQSGIFSGLEKLTGHKPSKEAYEKLKEYRPPTSKEIKEYSEKKTKGLTSPKNETERAIDEYVETAASFLGPMKFRKALGVALGGTLAKEGIKISGMGEGPQEAGKLGTMFLATMYNPGGALKYSASQFEKANQLAKGASINVSGFEKNLNTLIADLEKGVTTTEKTSVLKPARELVDKIKNGKLAVQELTAAKRDINKLMGEPETLKGAKKLLKILGKEVDNAIKPYERLNSAFSKAYRPANEIHGAVMQGQKASNFVRKILGSKSVLGAVAGEAILGHPEFILPTLAGAGATLGTAKTADFFMRLAKSPELQKYYARALTAAAKEDVGALRKYENAIENILIPQ